MYSSRAGRIVAISSWLSERDPASEDAWRIAWECCPDACALPLQSFQKNSQRVGVIARLVHILQTQKVGLAFGIPGKFE